MVRRVLKGAGERVGQADCVALREMIELREDLENAITEAVAGLRNDLSAPATWGDIGKAIGMRREHAYRRYHHVGGSRPVGGQPANWR